MTKLTNLKPYQSGIITNINHETRIKNRLYAMGVMPNAKVTLIRTSLFGGPIQIHVSGTIIALRQCDGAKIFVRRIDDDKQDNCACRKCQLR